MAFPPGYPMDGGTEPSSARTYGHDQAGTFTEEKLGGRR